MVCNERVIQTFLDLCNINSPSFNERLIGDYISTYCRQLGLEVIEDDTGQVLGGNCGNILVKLPGKGEGFFNVFLSAHMDTVEPNQNIQIIREEGKIKTDGRTILGADDKIGVAALLEAIHVLIESKEDYAKGFLIFTIAEEKGLLGAKHVTLPENEKIDFGFVFDTGPEVGSIVMNTPFHYEFKIIIEGLPAHAGREPEKGINAIQLASLALSHAPQGRIDEQTTCNYGIIRGGEMNNIVCPKVEIQGEVRSLCEHRGKKVLTTIQKCFDENVNKRGGKYRFDATLHSYPYFHKKDDRVIQYILHSMSKINIAPLLKSSLGSSDANIWNSRSIPCLNIGVGMQNIHTVQEFCYEKDILTASKIARSILQAGKKTSIFY